MHQGLPAAVPDQDEVIFDEDLGNELVVPGLGGVSQRFHRLPPETQPVGCAAVDLGGCLRIERCQMEPCELREERMDSEPASLLEAGREQVQPLELLDERGRVGSPKDVVAHLGE